MAKPKLIQRKHSLGVRIEKSDYRQLCKRAKPESVATLIRRMIKDLLKTPCA